MPERCLKKGEKEENIRDMGEKTDENQMLLVILRTHLMVFILPLP